MHVPVITDPLLVVFQGVVDDRAEPGPPEYRRHAVAERPLARNQIGEPPARTRTSFVNHAEIPVQKDAPGARVTENGSRAVLGIPNRVLADHFRHRHLQVARQLFHVGSGQNDISLAATVGAGGAVDLFLRLRRNPVERAFRVMMRFEESPELQVLGLVRLGQAADLHQIRDHGTSIMPPAEPGHGHGSTVYWVERAMLGPLNIPDLLRAAAERRRQAPALLAPGRPPLAYGRLVQHVEETALALNSIGIGSNDRIALVLPDGPEMALCFLGVSSAAACAPLNPAYRTSELEFYLSDLKPGALIVQAGTESQAPRVARSLGIRVMELVPRMDQEAGVFSLSGLSAAGGGQPEFARPGDIALVLHTSGTTSRPKIVPLTHSNLCVSARTIQASLELGEEDRCLNIMPLFHVHGLIGAVLSSLAAGASVVCAPGFNAARFFEWLDEFRPTWYTAVPAMHQSILARAPQHRPLLSRSRLRFIRSCSAALAPKLMADLETEFHVPVIEAYGMTEASHQMAANPLPPGMRKPRSVGIATGSRIAVMDERGCLLPAGEVGDVVIQGDNVTRGYENNPRANEAAFHAGWFRTGDQGMLDGDGYLFLTGRTKEIINRGGEKVSPLEVDEALLEHPAVIEAMTFALPDARLGEEVGAAVVLREGMQAQEMELREFAAARLADFKAPRRIVLVKEIPKGPTGKPQRIGAAAKLGLAESAQPGLAPAKPFTPPRTETEALLVRLWREVLGVDQVGVHDNFFEAGGDSILAVQFLSRLRAAAGVGMSVARLLETPVLAAIAAWVDSGGAGQPDRNLPPLRRAAQPKEVPLAYSQQQVWFLEHLEEGGANYIRPAAFRLRGALRVDMLQRSLSEIVARHEILRTTYGERDGVPFQIAGDPRLLELPVTDLSTVPESERFGRVQQLAREEAWRRFDLSRDLMLRASLLRLGLEDHVLLVTMHHIASDGWSSRVLLRELAAFYRSGCEGSDAELPDLPIQYADFALWQRRSIEDHQLDGQLAYWKQQLAGSPELLGLPTDHPRPARQSYRGGIESAVAPKQLVGALKDLCLREKTTLYMVLLAAFQVLLHRYSGDEDLVVGSPFANRTSPEREQLIGLFMNVLPLRADLRGDPGFREFLLRTRAAALGAHANQDVPLEKIVESLSPNRSGSHPALYQVLFQLRNVAVDTARLGPVTVEPFDFDPGVGEFDLSLEVSERPEGLRCALNYNADVYEAATARRMLGHYQTLLGAIVEDPGRRVSRLNILPEAERRQMLVDWNETAAEFPGESCIHELVEAQARKTPDGVAVVFRGERRTYAELNRQASRRAVRLQKLGVKPGILVGICLERSAELMVSLLAVLKAGGAYVPLDPAYPDARLRIMLEDARCAVLITSSSLAHRFPAGNATVLCVDEEGGDGDGGGDAAPVPCARPSDCAYVIFTSGSTGRPKGILIEHRSLVNVSYTTARRHFQAADRVLQFHSFSFDFAAEEIFSCWLAGATLVLWPERTAPSAFEFLGFLERRQITNLHLPTAYWHELARDLSDRRLRFPSSVRAVFVGGEKAAAVSLQMWNKAVGAHVRWCNEYGPTEATIVSTRYEVEPGGAPDPVPIGRPLPNTTAYILDSLRQSVPIGVPGELYIGGAGVARGYLNQPELTAEKFVQNPFRSTPDPRLYRTGDLARYLADGNIEFLGRIDNQVKLRGYRIELGEIENLLASHLGIRAAAVSLLDAANSDDRRLVAYIVPDPSAAPSTEQLRGFLRERLPDYMLPSQFACLDKLPMTPNGKVDRRALPRPKETGAAGRAALAAPRTPLEEKLAAVWTDVLGAREMGIRDNFFDLGGNSLKLMQVASRLRIALQIDIPLRRLFEAPTIAGMAVAILEIQAAPATEGSGRLDSIQS